MVQLTAPDSGQTPNRRIWSLTFQGATAEPGRPPSATSTTTPNPGLPRSHPTNEEMSSDAETDADCRSERSSIINVSETKCGADNKVLYRERKVREKCPSGATIPVREECRRENPKQVRVKCSEKQDDDTNPPANRDVKEFLASLRDYFPMHRPQEDAKKL